jgi:hypothetical protein
MDGSRTRLPAQVVALRELAAARRASRARVGRIGRLPGMGVAVDGWRCGRCSGAPGAESAADRAGGAADARGRGDVERARPPLAAWMCPTAPACWRRYYLAREFARAMSLARSFVECYPKLMGQVCLPIALFAEEDVGGACEGDVNSGRNAPASWFTGAQHRSSRDDAEETPSSSPTAAPGRSARPPASQMLLWPVPADGYGCHRSLPALAESGVNLVGAEGRLLPGAVRGEAVATSWSSRQPGGAAWRPCLAFSTR